MSDPSTSPRSFTSPRWVIVACAVAPILFAGVTYGLYVSEGLTWLALLSAGLAVFGLVALIDSLLTRVILHDRELEVVANLRRRSYARESFESVTWAKGVPVALKLRAGGWVKLPAVGSSAQGMVNTIRAWLRRAGSTP